MPPKSAADVAVLALTAPPLPLLAAPLLVDPPAVPLLAAALLVDPPLDAAELVVEFPVEPELFDELQAEATIATTAKPATAAIRTRAVRTDPPVVGFFQASPQRGRSRHRSGDAGGSAG
jgi:hypothetical protein